MQPQPTATRWNSSTRYPRKHRHAGLLCGTAWTLSQRSGRSPAKATGSRRLFAEHEQDDFRRYRDGEVDTPPLLPPEPEPRTLKDLAAELFWDIRHLEEIERLHEDKRHVVFYGPPGTGKTYEAQKLADYFAGEHGSTRLVQMDPSYAYERFCRGLAVCPRLAGSACSRGTAQADRATGGEDA